MDEYASLSHTKWECKHHVVFIPPRWQTETWGRVSGPPWRSPYFQTPMNKGDGGAQEVICKWSKWKCRSFITGTSRLPAIKLPVDRHPVLESLQAIRGLPAHGTFQ